MPTLSVKLPEETKQRLAQLAASQDSTVHAVMVGAIESALSQAEAQNSFVAAALRALEKTVASGRVVDGPAFADYLKAKARGRKVARPQPIDVATVRRGA